MGYIRMDDVEIKGNGRYMTLRETGGPFAGPMINDTADDLRHLAEDAGCEVSLGATPGGAFIIYIEGTNVAAGDTAGRAITAARKWLEKNRWTAADERELSDLKVKLQKLEHKKSNASSADQE